MLRRTVLPLVLPLLVLAAPALASPPPPDPDPPAGAPTLTRVAALARERSVAAVAAREDVAVARAELGVARLPAVANPYVELTAQRGALGVTKDVAINGTLVLPVEISGQRGRRIAEADALLSLRDADLGVARADTMAEAVRAYGAAAVAGARARAWERIVAGAREEASIYAARLAARDTTEQDARIARVEASRNEVTLAEARADLARALADLRRLTGARFTEAPAGAEPPEPARRPLAAPRVEALAREASYHARVRDRQAREAHAPLSLILNAGRGDLGELRVGGGVGWSLPLFRDGRAEAAKAEAARSRAMTVCDAVARASAAAVEGLLAEVAEVRRARLDIARTAEPAAVAAIEAAVAMQRAGKGDLLPVLFARRDFTLLEARRLDLLQREWNILGDVVALTGELP
jgi:cobalt-zinc-cadmium efflux system outer membrane protein